MPDGIGRAKAGLAELEIFIFQGEKKEKNSFMWVSNQKQNT